MELKNYLHLYLGAEVYIFPAETLSNGWYAEKKKGFQDGWGFYELTIPKYNQTLEAGYLLALRPLSDIKDHEHIESSVAYTDAFGKVAEDKSEWVKEWHGEFARTLYLLSKHFDLFGLIENGLAIDKTKI